MTSILFVCHGNICRSPMAQYVMQHLVDEAGLTHEFDIDSAAMTTEEIGNTPHRGTRRKLAEVGIPCGNHRARLLTRADYARFDYIIGMDASNMRGIMRILGSDPDGKVSKLMDFTARPHDVADPWYTGDFDATYRDVREGCEALLAHCLEG